MPKQHAAPPRKISGQTIFLAAAVLIAIVVLGVMLADGCFPRPAHVPPEQGDGPRTTDSNPSPKPLRLEDIPFDGARAYQYLQRLCDFGRGGAARPP